MIGSATDIIIIIIVAVVLFAGAGKIPELFHAMGRAVGEYKKGKLESEMELNRMVGSSAPQQGSDQQGSDQQADRAKQLEAQIAELQRQLEELKRERGGQ
ncbi:MAG: twin-arginine translocase TatA/TatE family subunit [Conexivisphaera sp.]